MNRLLLSVIVITQSSLCSSQVIFEEGYFIDRNSNRTECLIKNLDWKNNPDHFTYKVSETSEEEKATIESILEFGIYNVAKYIRETVNIDRSDQRIDYLTNDKNPTLRIETLFLKVLVEGGATLYQFTDNNGTKFFYQVGENGIRELINRKYRISKDKIGTNNHFRQQLWLDLKCPSFTPTEFQNIFYGKKELIRLFIKYHQCNKLEFTVYNKKQQRFHLGIRPGLNYSSLVMGNPISLIENENFGSQFSPRIGAYLEFALPFMNGRWTLGIEPTFQYFTAEKIIQREQISGGEVRVDITYQSISLPLSLRHYFPINQTSTAFLNVAYTFDQSFNSMVTFRRASGSLIFNPLEPKSKNYFGTGVGVAFKKKYSVELRYYFDHHILAEHELWESDFNTIALIIGYNLF